MCGHLFTVIMLRVQMRLGPGGPPLPTRYLCQTPLFSAKIQLECLSGNAEEEMFFICGPLLLHLIPLHYPVNFLIDLPPDLFSPFPIILPPLPLLIPFSLFLCVYLNSIIP